MEPISFVFRGMCYNGYYSEIINCPLRNDQSSEYTMLVWEPPTWMTETPPRDLSGASRAWRHINKVKLPKFLNFVWFLNLENVRVANYIWDKLLGKFDFSVKAILKLCANIQKCLKMAKFDFTHKPLTEKGHGEQPALGGGLYVKCETISNFQGNLWTSDMKELTEHQIRQDHRGTILVQENNAIEPSLKDHFALSHQRLREHEDLGYIIGDNQNKCQEQLCT